MTARRHRGDHAPRAFATAYPLVCGVANVGLVRLLALAVMAGGGG